MRHIRSRAAGRRAAAALAVTVAAASLGTAVTHADHAAAPNTPPTASFSYLPATPFAGDSVSFTSTSSDPDGRVIAQAWDLDDDGAFDDGAGTTASRSFGSPGTYRVRLRVQDNRGGRSVAQRDVTVANRPPTANFSFSPAAPLTGEQVTFTATAEDDDEIEALEWDFDGDGFDDGDDETEQWTFARPGEHIVRLRASEDDGASVTVERRVEVGNRAPAASFSVTSGEPLSGEAVTFTSTSADPDGAIVSERWDVDGDGFDDGAGRTLTHAFARPGTHDVRLEVVDDSGAAAIAAGTVAVRNRPPAAGFTFSPSAPRAGEETAFSSTATDPDGQLVTQAWDLDGDGQYDDASGPSARHTFSEAGSRPVALRVTDDQGASAVAFATVDVAPPPPPPPPPDAGNPETPAAQPPPTRPSPAPGVPRAPATPRPPALLRPFPVVRIRGVALATGARISLLSVRAPGGSRITTRCRGRSCPFRARSVRLRRRASGARIRGLERFLRRGTVLRIAITKPRFIGKYTELRIRALRAPVRIDRCLVPGRARPTRCRR